MRVLLVANTLPPTDLSGVGEQVLQLAAGLESRGHEVRVLGRGENGARGPKLLFPITVALPLLRALRRFRPDVVQVHESDGAVAAFLVKVVSALANPRPILIALVQVSYLEELRSVRPLIDNGRVLGRPGLVEWRFKFFKAPLHVVLGCLTVWLADLVLTPSRQTADEVERDYGVSGIQVLPNVTGGLPHQKEASLAPGVSRGAGETDGYFLFIGRLRIRKGVEVLLHAMVTRVGADGFSLLIAGDGEHRAALEACVSELALERRVRFLGRQSPAQVRDLIVDAAALVVPSTYEGMPLVVLEAMAAGVPVVASAVSGIPEVVVDGETGWLTPCEDVEALAEALEEVATDPVARRQRGDKGCQRVNDLFRPHNAAEQWETLVRSIEP